MNIIFEREIFKYLPIKTQLKWIQMDKIHNQYEIVRIYDKKISVKLTSEILKKYPKIRKLNLINIV